MLKNICIFGDSISKGVIYNTSRLRYTSLPDCFANLFSKEKKVEIKNYSIFGCTVVKGLSLLKRHCNDLANFDFIALEFGGNDCDFDWQKISDDPNSEHLPNTPINVFEQTYKKLIDEIKALKKTPIILNLPPLDSEKYFNWVCRGRNAENIKKWLGGNTSYIYRWHEMYSNTVCDIANSAGIKIIDLRSTFLKLRNYSDYLCEDGIHPNEKGHKLMFSAIKLAIN